MSKATKPHEIVERALELSRADGCVVIADEESSANLRWAGNALTTNGVTRGRTLTVIATVDGAQGTASGVVTRSAVTADDLEPLVRAAEAAAREAEPAEDAQPLVDGGPAGAGFTDGPAETGSEVFDAFAPALGEAFATARTGGRELYGFAFHAVTSTYLGTSTGVRLRHDQPTGTLELNAKSPDRTRSAWAGASTRDFRDADPLAMDADLARRLEWAERRVELPAGRYETLLPPSAVADLMIYQMWSAGARDAAEGRTVFSKPGGGTRLGEKLSALPLTLRSDPAEPGLESAPFVIAHSSDDDASVFDNGLPAGPVEWLREGTVNRLATTRHSAGLTGMPVAPAADNLVLEGGDAVSLEEMVAGTGRGLLLTCLWYIREVDPATLLLTGLTRDGVYLVENGEVTGAVNNFRFNESPVDLLGRATQAGRTERTLPREWSDWFTRAAAPPLRVPDFNMSSVSRGV
jgi:predicted Zn-dependent protease